MTKLNWRDASKELPKDSFYCLVSDGKELDIDFCNDGNEWAYRHIEPIKWIELNSLHASKNKNIEWIDTTNERPPIINDWVLYCMPDCEITWSEKLNEYFSKYEIEYIGQATHWILGDSLPLPEE